jgi:hypothetical protein
MGVSFFRETAPEDFATFDRSFYAMYERVKCEGRVGKAEPWDKPCAPERRLCAGLAESRRVAEPRLAPRASGQNERLGASAPRRLGPHPATPGRRYRASCLNYCAPCARKKDGLAPYC